MLSHLTTLVLDFEMVFVVRHPNLHAVDGAAYIRTITNEVQNEVNNTLSFTTKLLFNFKLCRTFKRLKSIGISQIIIT